MNPISIVIPTYNRLHTLKKVLKGLEKQTVKNFEVIIADDGSTEDTEAGISSFHSSLSIRYFRNSKNGGRASACNLGLKAVNTPLVVFLDNDLVPKPNWLKAHLDFHEKHPEEHYATYGKISWGPLLKKSPLLVYLETEGRYKNCSSRGHGEVMWDIPTGNTSFKASFLLRNKGFNPGFTEYGQEDLEFGKRLFKDGLVCLFNTKAFALHLHKLTESDFLRLAEKDGYSAAYFQTIDPDFKWGQSDFVVRKILESSSSLQHNFQNHSFSFDQSTVQIFEESARQATFNGMEKYFFKFLNGYKKFKEIALSEDKLLLEEFLIQNEILNSPVILSMGCFLMELKFSKESAVSLYEKIIKKYPDYLYLRKRLCEILNEIRQFDLLEKYFVPSVFIGNPELEVFRLILEVQYWIRHDNPRKASCLIDEWMKKKREWKTDHGFIENIFCWVYESGNYYQTYKIGKYTRTVTPFHFCLAMDLEKINKMNAARFLFQWICKSDIENPDSQGGQIYRFETVFMKDNSERKINCSNIKASAAFHLGRMLMEREPEKAIQYFEKTLFYIPDHGKAREYLDLLKRK